MITKSVSKKFEDLIVWKKAHALVLAIYSVSQTFPKPKMFGLTSQLRRSAVSIPANIAEGFKKKTVMDKIRFYNIAQGSLEECRYYLIVTKDLNYGNIDEIMKLLQEVSKLLEGYMKAILDSDS